MVSKIDLASWEIIFTQTLHLTVNKFQPKRRLQVEKRSEVTHDSWSPKFPFFANLAPTIFVSDFYHVMMLISSYFAIQFHLLRHMSWMGRLNFVERFTTQFALAFCLPSRSSVQLASVMRILLAPQQQGTSTSGLRTL